MPLTMGLKIFFLITVISFHYATPSDCPECCNLVYRTIVRDWPESSRKVWSAHFEWFMDDNEVENVVGEIDRFVIRHGRLKCWGGQIDEHDAHYLTLPVANSSLTLHKLPLGYYGVQICSFNKNQDPEINWNEAWVGTIDVGNMNGYARHSIKAADVLQSTCHSKAIDLKNEINHLLLFSMINFLNFL